MQTWQKWLIGGSILYAILKWQKPHWYEDLMCRAYATDYLAKPDPNLPVGTFEAASAAAAIVGLPVGWLIDVALKVKPGDLQIIAAKIRDKVLAMGPPADTSPGTLASYKAEALTMDYGVPPPLNLPKDTPADHQEVG